MMRMYSYSIALFIIGALRILSVAADCADFLDCATCTGGGSAATNGCVWCLNNNPITGAVTNENIAGKCAESCSETSTGQLGVAETKSTKTFRDGYNESTFVGIDVEEVYVELRKGSAATFDIRLTKGPVPFQLYFLLDLSGSMENILEAVKKSAVLLPATFDNDPLEIKPEFEFGFGSFVDKSTPPYTYDRLEYSVPTYGFRHEVTFTKNSLAFTDGLSGVEVSGNNDLPEGGLDAVVQALYCEKLIQWKSLDTNALRLILMTTDDTSHVAGDGIEAGLVWPHELKCHSQFFFRSNADVFISQMMNPLQTGNFRCLSTSGKNCWYHNVVHDYPSVDQIAEALRARKTDLAFVVPPIGSEQYPGRHEHYQDMAKSLAPNGLVAADALVNADSLDFTNIVRNTYYQIIRKKPEFTAIDGGDATFDDFYAVTSTCGVATSGDKIVAVTLPTGPIDIDLVYDCSFSVVLRGAFGSSQNLTQIQSQGAYGSFEVMVRSSSCQCPSPPNPYFATADATKYCSDGGTVSEARCGECDCDQGTSGEACDCSEEGKFQQCKVNSDSGLQCSGVGICECGKCRCTPPFSGEVCECSDQCDEPNEDLRCGGLNAGTCICETCDCKPGYTGKKCECNNNLCVEPDSTKVCNEVEGAVCNCGKCECPEPFSGDYCEFCDPVKAALLGTPDLCGLDDCGKCTRRPSDSAEPDVDEWGCECCFNIPDGKNDESLCQWCYESNQCIARETITKAQTANPKETVCTAGFKTITNTNNETRKELFYAVFENVTQCPTVEADVTAIVVGVLLGLLALIILALLLWRLFAYMSDKKEWENYEKDKARSKWQADSNPIFKSSVTEFENPIFE